jgi:hypothetical protein
MKLPLEILECIIQQLDTPSRSPDICSCALAGRVLVRLSQKRLLRSVKLIQTAEQGQGEGPAVTIRAHPIDRFYNSLRQNPSLGAYVRELEIRCTPRSNHPSDHGFAVLGLLGYVHSLKFGFAHGHTSMGWTRSWSEDNLCGITKEMTSLIVRNPITSLYLFGIRDLDPSFVSQASTLKHLTVQHVSLDESSLGQKIPLVSIRLATLALLEKTGEFAKQCATGSGFLNISRVICLTMDSADEENISFLPIFLSLEAIEVLDLRMDSECN